MWVKSQSMLIVKESGQWKGSPKVLWAVRPIGFTEGNQAIKLRAELEVLSKE